MRPAISQVCSLSSSFEDDVDGYADAALALAATYDPQYLAQHSLIGVVGDETKARSWYQRARELGSPEADRILARTDAD